MLMRAREIQRALPLHVGASGSDSQSCSRAQIKNESLYDVVTEDEFVKRMMKNPDTMEFVVDDRDADQGTIRRCLSLETYLALY